MLPNPTHNVRRIAEECLLQQSGEISVANMFDAWAISVNLGPSDVTERTILALAHNIEPLRNAAGYRQYGVRVGSHIAPKADKVPGLMTAFFEELPGMPSGEAFYRFETIHPFGDGNGRTGYLMWNILNGTMAELVPPPNYWNDPYRGVMTAQERTEARDFYQKYRT
jgi:hypothetical protein